MSRLRRTTMGLLVFASAVFSLGQTASGQAGAPWVTLFDGTSLDGWSIVGTANWRLAEGAAQADQGTGFLLSKDSYADFEIRAELWVDADANSGIFIRCSDPAKISPSTAYEVNVFDRRPDPTYGTGAIVNVAKVSPMPKAEGKWNVMEITAKGPRLTVTFNGTRTVDVQDTAHARGPFALQYSAGVVKFRKIQIRPL